MIVVIGDLHLSDSRPWSWEVSQKIVDFILNHPLNNQDNIAFFTGDITEDAFLSGQVFDLMVKLFSSLKFQHTFVLVGNHDLKKNKQGKLTLSFKFLKRKPYINTIDTVDSPRKIVSQAMNILVLPWIPTDMKKEYETHSLWMEGNYDLLIGHFQDTTCNLPGESIDISHIKTKLICLGHIHDENLPNYVGSVVPNSVKGAGLPRYFRTYEMSHGRSEGLVIGLKVEIPHLMDYCVARFPDPLPKVNVETPVWTVYNCADETTAKAHYGNIYTRDTVTGILMDKEAFKRVSGRKTLSIQEMYDEWEKTAQYDKETLKLARNYFH